MFDPEFDHVYTIDALGAVSDDSAGLWAPDVALSDAFDGDVEVSTGWNVLKGFTGQYGYRGAVMHAYERWGAWAEEALAHEADESNVAFAVVEVRDVDGDYPDGDAVGWAVAWRVINA